MTAPDELPTTADPAPHPSAEPPPQWRFLDLSIGTFVRRLTWRRDVGPLRGEGRLEVRELTTEPTRRAHTEGAGPPPRPPGPEDA